MYPDVDINKYDTVIYSRKHGTSFLVDGSARRFVEELYTNDESLNYEDSHKMARAQIAMLMSLVVGTASVVFHHTMPLWAMLTVLIMSGAVFIASAAVVAKIHEVSVEKFESGIVTELPNLKNPNAVTPDDAEVLANLAEQGDIVSINRYVHVLDALTDDTVTTETSALRLSNEKERIAEYA